MSVFTKRKCEEKLVKDLAADVSKGREIRMWLLNHKIHFQAIVRTWFKELVKSSQVQKLAFLYLAYDVIWHSIEECPQFVTEFGMYMKKVFQHLVTVDFDEKAMCIIGELVLIWRIRRIFDQEIQDDVEKIWKKLSVDGTVVAKEIKEELSRIQLDVWKCQNKEFKKSSIGTDLKVKNKLDFQINAPNKIEYVEADIKCEEDTSAKLTQCNKEGSNENGEVGSKFKKVGLKCDDQYELQGRKGGSECLLKWINPTGESEKCTTDIADSPMREAMKRRIQFDDQGPKKTSKMDQQYVDNGEGPGMTEWVKISDNESEEPIDIATESDGTLLLVVYGLSRNTQEDDIKKYFEQFGEVLMVQLKKGPKCLAYIRFAKKEVELAVASKTYLIGARWCYVWYSDTNKADNVDDNDKNHGEIFVDQVTEALTSDDLRKHFESFGQVLDVYFSEPRKNFAFVQFSDRKIAMSLRNTRHLIKDANVRVGQCVNYGIDAQKAKLILTKKHIKARQMKRLLQFQEKLVIEKNLPKSRLQSKLDVALSPVKQRHEKPPSCSKNLLMHFRGREASPYSSRSPVPSEAHMSGTTPTPKSLAQSPGCTPITTSQTPAKSTNSTDSSFSPDQCLVDSSVSTSLKPADFQGENCVDWELDVWGAGSDYSRVREKPSIP